MVITSNKQFKKSSLFWLAQVLTIYAISVIIEKTLVIICYL